MKPSSWIALAAYAACFGASPSHAHADTHFEGHVQAFVAPVSASAAHATSDAIASAPVDASSGAASAHAIGKRRAAPRATRASAISTTRTRATQDDAPFAFRGIPLGVTLSALRETNMVRATPHESELLCETDVAAGDIGMTIKTDASPTIACRWAHRSARGWTPSHAVVDGVPAIDHILRFAHASAGEPLRLYEMSFVVEGATAFDLRDLLATRYGAPRVLGAPSLPLLVWDNGSSTITICLLPDSRRATLTYMLKPEGLGKRTGKAIKISQFDEG